MKPAVVIVHGAWHTPAHFSAFIQGLQTAGHEVFAPQLPSVDAGAAQCGIDDDVNEINKQIRSLVHDASRQVIVVAHSYGGVVMTQALESKDLSIPDRKAKGLSGGVLHIIYMCAFMLQPGESTFSASHSPPLDPSLIVVADDGTCTIGGKGPRWLLFADVQDEKAIDRAERLLVKSAVRGGDKEVTYPAWRYFPVTYLECTEDRMNLPPWQARYIRQVRESGVEIEVQTFKSGHSPFLSRTGEMVEVVEKVAAKYL